MTSCPLPPTPGPGNQQCWRAAAAACVAFPPCRSPLSTGHVTVGRYLLDLSLGVLVLKTESGLWRLRVGSRNATGMAAASEARHSPRAGRCLETRNPFRSAAAHMLALCAGGPGPFPRMSHAASPWVTPPASLGPALSEAAGSSFSPISCWTLTNSLQWSHYLEPSY